MNGEPLPPAVEPAPPVAHDHHDHGDAGALHTWSTGASVLAGCADLLVAVLLGLTEPISGAALRFDLRDLALCAGGMALVSFALAAAGWWSGTRGLVAAGVVHIGAAAATWFLAATAVGGLSPAVLGAAILHAAAGAVALAGAGASSAAARRGDGSPCPAGPARASAENLESVLVAIAFALVIRHFAVEAYKIPTESMAPTLLGEQQGQRPGDRVLVAKWPTLFGGPDRWEIWVFRPPEERTINYVKRVGGLPGETITIEDGDLYADGKICRKPPRAREALWFPVWPPAAEEKSPSWSGAGFKKEGRDGFSVAGAAGPTLLDFNKKVRDGPMGLSGSHPVGDVRLRFRVEAAEPGTVLLARITGRAGTCAARIAADGSSLAADLPGKPGVAGAAPGSPVGEVEVWFADLQFGVTVDGEPVVPGIDLEPIRGNGAEFAIALGVEKGGASFREVGIDRDVHYTDSRGGAAFRVPEGHYFFLGDNSSLSQDSRAWQTWEVREAGGAGRVFLAEKKRHPIEIEGRLEFRDNDGVLRSFAPDEIRVSDGLVPCPFVPAGDLHGRAFAIFWPPRWFTRVPGGRLGLLR